MEIQEVLISKENLFLKTISYCLDTYKKDTYQMKAGQALKEIREGKFQDIIKKLRDPDYPEADKARIKKKLKSYLFCGAFSYRNQDALLEYSNLCILDFDGIGAERVAEAKDRLLEDPYICAAWISPKGAGLKALVAFEFSEPTEDLLTKNINQCHKFAYARFRDYLCDKYPHPLDASGSDVTRLCYTSFDPEIGIKDNAKKYIVDFSERLLTKTYKPKRNDLYKASSPVLGEEEVMHIQRKTSQSARRVMKSIIKYLSKRQLSITSTERDWYLVGQAIANVFTYSIGKEYYLRLCRLDGEKHDEVKSKRKIIDCYICSRLEEGQPSVGMLRIMQFAKEKGWRDRRQRSLSREESLSSSNR